MKLKEFFLDLLNGDADAYDKLSPALRAKVDAYDGEFETAYVIPFEKMFAVKIWFELETEPSASLRT